MQNRINRSGSYSYSVNMFSETSVTIFNNTEVSLMIEIFNNNNNKCSFILYVLHKKLLFYLSHCESLQCCNAVVGLV